MNIIFGMCGQGRRFRDKGYTLPKYLIPCQGEPMIYHAVTTLNIPGRIHFVVPVEHLKIYSNLEKLLLSLGHEIIPCYKPTQGAAETLLVAKDSIQNWDLPLISANCDQYLDWSTDLFLDELNKNQDTSYIVTYKKISIGCSYIRKNHDDFIVEVREKKIISDDATIGIYHWAHTYDFFQDAQTMVDSGIKENNEFYVAPVYNWSIRRGLKIKNFSVTSQEFWPLGTPEELHNFNNQYKKIQ